MKVNLKNLKIAYINVPRYPNRNQTMINMLEYYGLSYSRIEGCTYEDCEERYPEERHPIAKSHLMALDSSPDIILEDDCLPFDYREDLDFPDNADVVFLGSSTGTAQTHSPKYIKISKDIYKLNDMTSLHAVLYITEAGRQWLRNAYEMTTKENIAIDIATARLMPTINAYGLNSPIWYQRDAEFSTKRTLDEAMLFDGSEGGGFDDYDKPYTIF
jgi:hypothetical protein